MKRICRHPNKYSADFTNWYCCVCGQGLEPISANSIVTAHTVVYPGGAPPLTAEGK